MKTLKFIFFFFCMISALSVWSQNTYSTDYEIRYKVNYSLDSLNFSHSSSGTLFLFTGNEYGVFMNGQKAEAEKRKAEMERQMRSGNYSVNLEPTDTDFPKTLYKNLQTGEVIAADFIGENYAYPDPGTPLLWEIKDSVQTILDYPVQKAVTSFAGRDYIAWFTTEIPIPDGPYVFSGLPGLIVQLHDTRKHYNFLLESVQKLPEPKVWEIENGTKIVTKSDFKELRKKALENAMAEQARMFEQSDDVQISVSVDGREVNAAEFRKMMKEIRERRNNPIELK